MNSTTNSNEYLNKQFEKLCNNCVEVLPENGLLSKLKEGRPLTVKFGCDPSRPDLHLGHAVVLRKLRQFQDFGHKVLLIIGDFTAMIGDPTGRSKTRPALSLEQTRENGQTYVSQATAILDSSPEKLKVVFNSEWLESLSFRQLIDLGSRCTVAQILAREDFKRRYSENIPISIHELLYPIIQAYDSYVINADIELGGTDQTFNLLAGRDIQAAYDRAPQVVMTLPLLVGLDGKEKMSKSLDNYIGITESPDVMYPKIMKVPDALLSDYFRYLTDVPATEFSNLDPVAAHHRLAEILVSNLHGSEAAKIGRERYDQVASGSLPNVLPTIQLNGEHVDASGNISIVNLVVQAGLAVSKGEARRAIQGRGIKIDGEVVEDPAISVSVGKPRVLQLGKNRFVRISVS